MPIDRYNYICYTIVTVKEMNRKAKAKPPTGHDI